MKTSAATRVLAGTFTWTDGLQMSVQGSFDQLATTGGSLAMVSMVSSLADIKAMRAALNGETTSNAMRFAVPEKDDVWRVFPLTSKYRVYMHRLPYGMAHALFISRIPGLLLNDDQETLWLELKSERYSTPLLRAWLPWVKAQLELEELLKDCATLGCQCRMMVATSEQLDDIIETGIRDGYLLITKESVA